MCVYSERCGEWGVCVYSEECREWGVCVESGEWKRWRMDVNCGYVGTVKPLLSGPLPGTILGTQN